MAIHSMVKSYKDLIGIFQGKQANYNEQILTLLFENGPLTAWQITGKMTTHGKVSLHATLNKRLRSLEKKEYLQKEGKMWLLHFKGILATLIVQKEPKPWNPKWTEIFENFGKYLEKHSEAFMGTTVRVNDITINPIELIDKSTKALKTLEDWILLSNYVKDLMQSGVINLDLISNRTLLSVILTQASDEEMKKFAIDWNLIKKD
jgi:hypothetical protein